MELQQIQELIRSRVYKDESGRECIALGNCRLDFEQEYLFFGFTKSGNVKLGEVYSSGPEGVNFRGRIGKVEVLEGEIKLWTDGYNYSTRIKMEAMQNAA